MTLADWIVLVLAFMLVFDSGPGRAGRPNRNQRPNHPRPLPPPAPPPIIWTRHADAVEAMHPVIPEDPSQPTATGGKL